MGLTHVNPASAVPATSLARVPRAPMFRSRDRARSSCAGRRAEDPNAVIDSGSREGEVGASAPPPAHTPEEEAMESLSLPAWIRWGLFALGFAFVGIGAIGVVLPLVPGVVFLLLAAGCFARSSPRFERWLVTHPRLGPPVVTWRRTGAIPRHAKAAAILGMSASLGVMALGGAPLVAIGSVAGAMAACAAYILTRPDAPRGS